MPYLSRIVLNPLRTGAQRMIRNPQVTHAAVLGGIARQPVTERALWRLDLKRHVAELLVLSESRPSWEHIVEQAGRANADEPQFLVRDYAPLLARVERGREFAFRLRANPTRSVRPHVAEGSAEERAAMSGAPRGQRVAHVTTAQQVEWLLSRVHRWGFEIPPGRAGAPDVALVGRETVRFRRSRASDARVTLGTATYEGRARVRDPDLLRQALVAGVGPARAYGCGLLTLAPMLSTPR